MIWREKCPVCGAKMLIEEHELLSKTNHDDIRGIQITWSCKITGGNRHSVEFTKEYYSEVHIGGV